MSKKTEVQVTLCFLRVGLLTYVIVPGLLVVWDRVLDHIGNSKGSKR